MNKPQKKSARILIVDDEPMILTAYSRMLKELDAVIIEAGSAQEGLRVLEQKSVDVVVADYSMPGMNGTEFLEQVWKRWPTSVRVLATGVADVQVAETAVRQSGVFRFITKPCDADKLISDLQDALAHHHLLQEHHLKSEKLQLDLHSYRQIFSNASDPMMVADLDGRVVEVNEAFVKSMGGSKEEALRRRPTIIGPLEEQSRWSDIWETIQINGSWSQEVFHREEQRHGVLSISAVRNDEGRAYALVALEKDITASRRLEEQARAAQFEVILALARMAEYRDPETGAHLERMRRYSWLLAKQLSKRQRYQSLLDQPTIEAIFAASPVHDIGKVGIPDSVLLKPGKFTPGEWKIIKLHPEIGEEVLSAAGKTLNSNNWLSMAQIIAVQHHEKWNGSGYPNGLQREEIDIAARIVALADAYDAISSKRVYKESQPHEVARERILESNESHFDPDVVQAFLEEEEKFIKVRSMHPDVKATEVSKDQELDEEESMLRRIEQLITSSSHFSLVPLSSSDPAQDLSTG